MSAVAQQALVLKLIERAVSAGKHREAARLHPEARRGLLRFADKRSSEVAELAGQVRDEPFAGDETP